MRAASSPILAIARLHAGWPIVRRAIYLYQIMCAVTVTKFERIHRSNLFGMGVLPLQFDEGGNRRGISYALDRDRETRSTHLRFAAEQWSHDSLWL